MLEHPGTICLALSFVIKPRFSLLTFPALSREISLTANGARTRVFGP